MSLTAFGPQGPNYAFTRPPRDSQLSAGLDTWFANASGPGAADGTFQTADFFNTLVANLRNAVAGTVGNSGLDNSDNMLLNAIQHTTPATTSLTVTDLFNTTLFTV